MSVKEYLIENDETSLAGCLLTDPERALREISDITPDGRVLPAPGVHAGFPGGPADVGELGPA